MLGGIDMRKLEKCAVSGIKVLDVHSEKHQAQRVAKRDFYSLSYRYAGRIKIEANGSSYTSGAGSVTFTPKGEDYCTEVCEDTHMAVIHFTLAREIETSGVCVIDDEGGRLKPYFNRLAATFKSADTCDFEAMALFYQLLSELSRIEEAGRAIPSIAVLAKEEIERSFANASLSISSIASGLSVSDSYLRRVFRDAYGMSPLAYLTHVRIRYAKNMLESEFFSIDQIGALCGFQSVGYFIQCFRSKTGETPGNYRKRKRGAI